MNRKSALSRAVRLATLLLVLASAERAVAVPYSYDIVIRPDHANVIDSYFFDINSHGQATGYVATRINGVAAKDLVTYRNGAAKTLATTNQLPGNYSHAGFAINNQGEVVGNINDVPYFFDALGAPTPIEVPGNSVSLFVSGLTSGGINDAHNVLVGVFRTDPATTPPGGFSSLALWSPQGSMELSALNPLYPYINPPIPDDFESGPSSSSSTSSATRINSANQFAAGVSLFAFDPKDLANPDDDVFTNTYSGAYIYKGNGAYKPLQQPLPDQVIRPLSIDELGTVFGWAGDNLALWDSDGVFLGLLPSPIEALDAEIHGSPRALRNNLGQVVAVTLSHELLLYDPSLQSWSKLSASIEDLPLGTEFNTITGLNDLGQFVGLARPPLGGGSFGYLVSPVTVPEPATLALLAVGCLAVALFTVCRRRTGLRTVSVTLPQSRLVRGI